MRKSKRIPIDGYISIITCFTLGVLCALQFIFRSMLNQPLAWTEESAGFFYVALVFFSTSYAVRENLITRVEIIDTLLVKHPGIKQSVNIIAHMISSGFSLTIAYYGIDVVRKAFAVQQRSPALLLPMGAVYIVIPAAFIWMGYRYLQLVFSDVQSFRKRLRECRITFKTGRNR